MVAEAVENSAARGALRVLGKEGDADAVIQSCSNEIPFTVKERRRGRSSHLPGSRSADLVEFEGDRVPLCGLLQQTVQCVRVTQV